MFVDVHVLFMWNEDIAYAFPFSYPCRWNRFHDPRFWLHCSSYLTGNRRIVISVTVCSAMRRVVQIVVVVTLTLLCIFLKGFSLSTLEVVTDDELLNLVRTEKYVVVLFSEYPYHGEVMLLCINTCIVRLRICKRNQMIERYMLVVGKVMRYVPVVLPCN
jgi:hypothetical protein